MNPTQKAPKAKFSSADIRAQALEARDELMANVEFLMECIREDRHKMRAYKEKFGDVRYRPIIRQGDQLEGPIYGTPTEVHLEPLASSYRSTINSLLQSIKIIQTELINDEVVESSGAQASQEMQDRRSSLRESFKEDTVKESDFPIEELESTPEEMLRPSILSSVIEETKEDVAVIKDENLAANPKPWRTAKSQTTFIPQPGREAPKTEEVVPPQKPITSPGIVGLSPALRMQLEQGGKMASLRSKYGSGKEED